jgi:hypothetical protein
LLTNHQSPIIAPRSLLTNYYFPIITSRSLLTDHYFPIITPRPLLTDHTLLPNVCQARSLLAQGLATARELRQWNTVALAAKGLADTYGKTRLPHDRLQLVWQRVFFDCF